MIASLEDAQLLFHRWEHHTRLIQIKLVSSSLIFNGVGTVIDSSPDVLKLGGDSWEFAIPLADAVFSFSDPREAPVASVRDSESMHYELGLSLQLPSGDQLVLLELKGSDGDHDDDEHPEDDHP